MQEFVTYEEAKNDLLSCAVYLAGKINSNESQAVVLEPIVERYLQKDDVDNAAQIADAIKDNFTRNKLLISVISKCVEIDDDEYAFQLVDAINDVGTRATAREAIALRKAAKGQFDKALEIAESLEHSSDAYAGIAVNQVKKGFDGEAQETLSKIDFYKSKAEALIEMALFSLGEKKAEAAASYLEKALVESEQIEFNQDKIRVLMEIGMFFVEAEKNDRAIDAFGKASSEIEKLEGPHKDPLLANVSVGFLKAGSVDLADRTLDLVIDKTQVANCLVGYSQIFEKEGDKEESLDALEEAYAILKSQQEGEIQDSKSRFQLFATIAVQFARLEKMERALEIAHENPAIDQKTTALTNIAQLCVLQEKDELASQVIKGIDDDSQRLAALVALSDAKNTAEKKGEAVDFLSEAETFVDAIPQFIAKSDTQNDLAGRFGFYGETEKARELASKSLQTIEEILGENNRSLALTELSKVYNKHEFELSEDDKEILEMLVRKSDQ